MEARVIDKCYPRKIKYTEIKKKKEEHILLIKKPNLGIIFITESPGSPQCTPNKNHRKVFPKHCHAKYPNWHCFWYTIPV